MKTNEEFTMEEQQSFWENEIALFGKYLAEEGKLKADTIDKHMDRIQLMATVYFDNYEIDYEELQREIIIDFLGRFYISNVLNSSKSDISAYLPSIKKWVQFLLQSEKISAKQCTEIVEVCKHKEFFIERFEQYMDANSDRALENWHNSNDFEAYLAIQASESAPIKVEMRPILVDKKLLEQWMDEKTAVPQIVADFQIFLASLQDAKSIKLTTARQHLPRNFWKELNEKLGWELFRKPTLNQDQVPLFQFFFYAAEHLGLITGIKQQCVVTNQAASYLALTDKEQGVVLLDSLWNKVEWGQLQESNEGGRPEWVQESRKAIASVLASWPVDQAQDVENEWKLNTDVFLHSVVAVLERFDLVSAKYRPESEIKYAFERTPLFMTVKDSGMRVFRYFANENVRPQLKPAVVRDIHSTHDFNVVSGKSKIGRNDPCPCGSGKKYKKCCL
ncbi:YecA family protein [Paenibacillus alginolyticus]|uniref:SEC-C metal-binding domain-containing protein n=1 Tax=Paenibacillus alginolyticus TaxID=59839 RepID=A0ABT4G8R2_9BACL|nr:SEC-C metal-binding domain-containing protein [Paenibacillus alginolyticus]MCY9692581.1 SEC-C metal-binding domain-containing protein [Paenibacillus alginolyticus]MEC0143788.1 SEC-C metal-binding domain-containing protein [Paenibacillus alginolyticus]